MKGTTPLLIVFEGEKRHTVGGEPFEVVAVETVSATFMDDETGRVGASGWAWIPTDLKSVLVTGSST